MIETPSSIIDVFVTTHTPLYCNASSVSFCQTFGGQPEAWKVIKENDWAQVIDFIEADSARPRAVLDSGGSSSFRCEGPATSGRKHLGEWIVLHVRD
jgi:hypothetical protein